MIEIRGLTKAYDGRPVLRGIDLRVRPGERVALVGPNGSGKTTLMRAVLGFVRAGGSVRVAGHDPWNDHAAAQVHVAYVPQRAPALPVPVGDMVAAWAQMRGLPTERLHTCAAAFLLDLDAIRAVRFVSLSGGMQQKLLAAMALASECPLLVFDEPTANLDPKARQVFLDALAHRLPSSSSPQAEAAPTVVLSSPRLDEVRHLVDRVVVLTDGSIRSDAGLDAFLADPTLAAEAGLDTHPGVIPFRSQR